MVCMTSRKRPSSKPFPAGAPESRGHPLSPGGTTYALLDANVLLPPRLSDILFDLCLEGLFSARWSAQIEAEFVLNWAKVAVRSRNSGSTNAEIIRAQQRLECYKGAVHGHQVFGHDHPSVLARLPVAVNAGDRHVAAAALVLQNYAGADGNGDKVYLISNNLKHLAVPDMARLGVAVISPGDFIDSLVKADHRRVGLALEKPIDSLKTPPYTHARLLDVLRIHGAHTTATFFARVWSQGSFPE